MPAYLNINTPANGKRRITLGRSNNVNERDNLKIENQVATNYTKANMAFGGTGVGASTKFGLTYNYNTNQDTGFTGINVDANITGTTAITADRRYYTLSKLILKIRDVWLNDVKISRIIGKPIIDDDTSESD